MQTLPIAYAAAIFFALTLGGLMALRRLPNLAVRAIGFVLLCLACFRVTFWLDLRWNLDSVELGVAWAAALVFVVAVEAIRVWRTKRSLA